MPWNLDKLALSGDDSAEFVFAPSLPLEVIGAPEGIVPPKEYWPLKIKQTTDHEIIADYRTGPFTNWLMVSKRFKDLVETWDPVQHVFVPIEITKRDGTVLKDQHFFLFAQGDIEGGIDLARSDVEEKWMNGKLIRYVNRLQPPILCWYRSKIRGRHLWSDPMFKKAIIVSDELFEWLKRNKIWGYQAQACLVTEDEV